MRLIDADALIKKFEEAVKYGQAHGMMEDAFLFGAFINQLENENVAPTIDPAPRWIPVTERLPDKGDYVLVCATCKVTNKIDYMNAVTMAFVCVEGFIDTELDEVLAGVTHWMPLPEPPVEVQDVH
ncbi:MAG: DUF551 domain-containing protein [Oscillospiraceae bacterium]|nr:DUF551 domain-containing protein [Oscillospiraceae bacterium]